MDKPKILIIDNEKEFSFLLKTKLERNGYEIIAVYNGEEGGREGKDE